MGSHMVADIGYGSTRAGSCLIALRVTRRPPVAAAGGGTADGWIAAATSFGAVRVQLPLRAQTMNESGHWLQIPAIGRGFCLTAPVVALARGPARLNTLDRMSFGRPGRFAPLLFVPVAVFLASCGLFHSTSAPAGMGQEVVDGKFAFIVNDISTSPTFGPTSARGVWSIVSMAVRNVGTGPRVFEMGAQSLTDSEGRGHSATLMEPPLANKIDPGLQVSVRLAFDVPPGVRPNQIVLRGRPPHPEHRSNWRSRHPQLHTANRG